MFVVFVICELLIESCVLFSYFEVQWLCRLTGEVSVRILTRLMSPLKLKKLRLCPHLQLRRYYPTIMRPFLDVVVGVCVCGFTNLQIMYMCFECR